MAKARVLDLADRLGVPHSISAIDALQEKLGRTVGRVAWLENQPRQRLDDPNLRAVYSAEQGAPRQLAGGMVSTKTDERRSMLSEQLVNTLEAAITSILNDLGPVPRTEAVRSVVARHLRVATGDQRPGANIVTRRSPPASRGLSQSRSDRSPSIRLLPPQVHSNHRPQD